MHRNIIFALILFFSNSSALASAGLCADIFPQETMLIGEVKVDVFKKLSIPQKTEIDSTLMVPFQIKPKDSIVFIVRNDSGQIVDHFILLVHLYAKKIAGREVTMRMPAIFTGKNMVDLTMDMGIWRHQKKLVSASRTSVVELPLSTKGTIEIVLPTRPETLNPQNKDTSDPSIYLSVENGKFVFKEDSTRFIRND